MDAVIAVGSNKGNRHLHLQQAYQFLYQLSLCEPLTSTIYLTEPVGPARRYFLNGVIEISIEAKPPQLFGKLKTYEQSQGRPAHHPKWGPRVIDLDIIACDDLVIQKDNLIIPHPGYRKRLFVLTPLQDIHPRWKDPKSGRSITALTREAPPLRIKRTSLGWQNGK